MRTQLPLKIILLGAGLFFLLVGINSCSDDGENEEPPIEMVEMMLIPNTPELSENTITIQKIIVHQDSWLVAVNEADTGILVAQPLMLAAGIHYNVALTFNEFAIKNRGWGQVIVLQLYADNQLEGKKGEWDSADEPIKDVLDKPLTRVVTIFGDYDPFAYYDNNNNGTLDLPEVSLTYPDNFAIYWDSDHDGNLNMEEFYWAAFLNTDVDFDFSVSQDEWYEGYSSMYSNWAEDNFTFFDESNNNYLDNEEWNKVFGESQWFETYDSDDNALVSKEEWNKGLLGDWDTNDDGLIDEDEFNNYWPHADMWVEYYEW